MTHFDSHSRDQLRVSYAEAWAKHRAGSALTPLEALIADVIGVHPEYQAVLRNAAAATAFEADSAGAVQNPFLHMGLHLAVREQVSIDRPPGIRELLKRLGVQLGDPHRAEHVLMEALAETLWQAQRDGIAPDEKQYFHLAKSRLGKG